ncbi:MAG: hypothetical protein M3680_33580, partial [Myxococcota bacterium]|nr:hypothetical protein [Myxococcota bacterium]
MTIAIGRDGGSLRGVAGDSELVFAAVTQATPIVQTVIEARRGAAIAWTRELTGDGGPLARTTSHLIATLAGASAGGLALR